MSDRTSGFSQRFSEKQDRYRPVYFVPCLDLDERICAGVLLRVGGECSWLPSPHRAARGLTVGRLAWLKILDQVMESDARYLIGCAAEDHGFSTDCLMGRPRRVITKHHDPREWLFKGRPHRG